MVSQWKAEDQTSECAQGEEQCGSFELNIEPVACKQYLCVSVVWGGAHVGAATGDEGQSTAVINITTGRAVDLEDVVGPSFTGPIKAAIRGWQDSNGLARGDWPDSLEGLAAWLPQSDGVHVFFEKYSIGPGAMGVPELVVPYPGKASAPKPLVDVIEKATEWLCAGPVEGLPRLSQGSSDSYAVSALQTLLTMQGYFGEDGVIDGQFGPVTDRAVKNFQRDGGLTVDGLVGPQTWDSFVTFYCSQEPEGDVASPVKGGPVTSDVFPDFARAAVPDWSIEYGDLPAHTHAAEAIFGKKPMYDTAGYFAMLYRYPDASGASAPQEDVYLASVERNAEASVHGLEPFGRVQCMNVVIIAMDRLTKAILKNLNQAGYRC